MSQVESTKVTLTDDELEIYKYFEILWRYRYIILGFLITALLATAIISWVIVPVRYEATSFIQVGQAIPIGTVGAYKEVLLSSKELRQVEDVVRKQKMDPKFRAEVIQGAPVIKLSVQGYTPESAEALGNLWYNAFLVEVKGLWIKKLETQLVLQQDVVKNLKENFQPAYFFKANTKNDGMDGQVVFQDSGDVISQAIADLARMETQFKRLRQNQIDDIIIISPFKAKLMASNKSVTLAIAGFLALMIGGSSVILIDNLNNYKQGFGNGRKQ